MHWFSAPEVATSCKQKDLFFVLAFGGILDGSFYVVVIVLTA
jgi:hypothetical protein